MLIGLLQDLLEEKEQTVTQLQQTVAQLQQLAASTVLQVPNCAAGQSYACVYAVLPEAVLSCLVDGRAKLSSRSKSLGKSLVSGRVDV